jgi:hypothetical protein
MKIDIKVIRLQGALHALRESGDPNHLIVHSDRSLFAIVWAAVQNTPAGVAVSLGPKGPGTLVATDVAVDNAWVIDPKSQRVLLAREGAFESIDPWGQLQVQTIKVPGLPAGTFASAVDSYGERVLVVVVREVNPDVSNYAIVLADLTNGRVIREGTIGTGSDLELLWDSHFQTWIIGDTSNGALWLWDGMRSAVKLPGPAGHVRSATFTATTEGVMVSAISAEASGDTVLVTGHVERDRIVWTGPVSLRGGISVLTVWRHPARSVWACLAQAGTAQQVQLRNISGKLLTEISVQAGVHLIGLQWSSLLADRLWGVGNRALVAVTISE